MVGGCGSVLSVADHGRRIDGGEGRWKGMVGVAGRDGGGQLQVRCKLLFGKRVCRPSPHPQSFTVRRLRRDCLTSALIKRPQQEERTTAILT